MDPLAALRAAPLVVHNYGSSLDSLSVTPSRSSSFAYSSATRNANRSSRNSSRGSVPRRRKLRNPKSTQARSSPLMAAPSPSSIDSPHFPYPVHTPLSSAPKTQASSSSIVKDHARATQPRARPLFSHSRHSSHTPDARPSSVSAPSKPLCRSEKRLRSDAEWPLSRKRPRAHRSLQRCLSSAVKRSENRAPRISSLDQLPVSQAGSPHPNRSSKLSTRPRVKSGAYSASRVRSLSFTSRGIPTLERADSGTASYPDIVRRLPRDLRIAILKYLSVSDLVYSSEVCRMWYQAASAPVLWRTHCNNLRASHATDDPKTRTPLRQISLSSLNLDNSNNRADSNAGLSGPSHFETPTSNSHAPRTTKSVPHNMRQHLSTASSKPSTSETQPPTDWKRLYRLRMKRAKASAKYKRPRSLSRGQDHPTNIFGEPISSSAATTPLFTNPPAASESAGALAIVPHSSPSTPPGDSSTSMSPSLYPLSTTSTAPVLSSLPVGTSVPPASITFSSAFSTTIGETNIGCDSDLELALVLSLSQEQDPSTAAESASGGGATSAFSSGGSGSLADISNSAGVTENSHTQCRATRTLSPDRHRLPAWIFGDSESPNAVRPRYGAASKRNWSRLIQ